MSPVAAPAAVSPLPPSPVLAELTSLAGAASNVEAKSIADSIALQLKKSPNTLHALQDAKIVDVVLLWSSSKSGYERESAPVLVERLCKSLGTGVEGVFIPLIPALLSLSMDKGQPVRTAVTSAINALVKACPAEGARLMLDALCRTLEDAKGWRSKVSALKAMEALIKPGSEEYVANELGHVIPFVERAMHDTKTEVGIHPSGHYEVLTGLGLVCCSQDGHGTVQHFAQCRYHQARACSRLGHGLAHCCAQHHQGSVVHHLCRRGQCAHARRPRAPPHPSAQGAFDRHAANDMCRHW